MTSPDTPPYQAAIFDLDGLLLETEAMSLNAGQEALAAMAIPCPPGLFASLIGRDEATAVRMIGERLGPEFDFGRFWTEWETAFRRRYEAGIPLRPQVTALLDRLTVQGLPLAVATSSRRESAARKIAIAGIAHYFRTVVSVDCVPAPKPAPDPYLMAAQRLGADPARCIAFEDSDTGASAARAAGMTVVQVPDLQVTDGAQAHHLATDVLSGARMAGLVGPD